MNIVNLILLIITYKRPIKDMNYWAIYTDDLFVVIKSFVESTTLFWMS